VLTFASDAATVSYGTSASGVWNKPLRRNLPRLA
jgi:hypothetical protein